jgi:NTP pyrophosphatase (non-canonical NTP hydrolase)
VNQFDEYQAEAKRTLNTAIERPYLFANLGMGLAGEAGEVCDYLKKVVFHGHKLDPKKVEEELGDVLWYLANLADAVGLSLDQIAEKNIKKLRKRYPNGFEQIRSQQRT